MSSQPSQPSQPSKQRPRIALDLTPGDRGSCLRTNVQRTPGQIRGEKPVQVINQLEFPPLGQEPNVSKSSKKITKPN